MQVKKTKKLTLSVAVGLAAAAALSSSIHANDVNQASSAYRAIPFPAKWIHYDTELFRLVDPDYSIDPQTKESHYDPQLAREFDKAVWQFSRLDKKLKKKLLSGPAPHGTLIKTATGSDYVFYTVCQAHWCNVTNIAILYQPESKRMVGRLLYACDRHPFGDINQDELQVINQLAPVNADATDCKFAKDQK